MIKETKRNRSLRIKIKSIIIKGVILFHNDGTFFIEAKVIDDFANLLKVFFGGVDVITVLDFAGDSIPYHSTSCAVISNRKEPPKTPLPPSHGGWGKGEKTRNKVPESRLWAWLEFLSNPKRYHFHMRQR